MVTPLAAREVLGRATAGVAVPEVDRNPACVVSFEAGQTLEVAPVADHGSSTRPSTTCPPDIGAETVRGRVSCRSGTGPLPCT